MRSLRVRLFLAFLGTSLLVLLVMGGVAVGMARRAAERATLRELRNQVLALPAQAQGIMGVRRMAIVRHLLAVSGARIFLAEPGGDLRELGGNEVFVLPAEVASALDQGEVVTGRAEGAGGERLLFAAAPIGGGAGVIVVARPASEANPGFLALAGVMLPAFLLAALASAVAAALLSGATERPLAALAATCSRLASGNLSARAPETGPDEIKGVARALNFMAGELERAREREREFLMSVSHELRTPLTAVRGYAEALAEGAAGPEEAARVVLGEAGRLERLVGDLLDLARMGAREFSVTMTEVDLAQVAREAADAAGEAARRARVELVLEAEEPLPARTDPIRVRQALANLLENALRVTPEGGQVRMRARREGSLASLEVEDDGPGLEPEDLVRAFDRFYLWRKYRGERRVGTGLGLAIVKGLASLLGGRVEAGKAEQRKGARFRILLPLGA